ncbi:MAG TPA: FUSC family protein [Streptosporangiaceae bacterium]
MAWPHISDPGLSSLRFAIRAAVLIPAVFAVATQVLQDPQLAVFAAFGSFALLAFVDFRGTARSRLTAYVSLAAAGAVLVVLGTLCSRNAWLAAGSMAVVGFIILFSGAINGYFAGAATAAILPFVLPVSLPAPMSVVGSRLAGWCLAGAVAIVAVMLVWPPRQAGTLRGAAARACLALAEAADCVLGGQEEVIGARLTAAADAVDTLRGKFEATSHRPTGPTRQAAALAALVDELRWLLGSLRMAAESAGSLMCRAENGQAMAAAATVLRGAGQQLAGRSRGAPDTTALDAAQEAVTEALTRRFTELPELPDNQTLEDMVGRTFRVRLIASTTRQISVYAAEASTGKAARPGRPVVAAVRDFAREHAASRSVSFRNAVRGAAGLAVAVFIAQRAGLQHSYWVVLGTLSVLRSNALGTGRSIVGALAGTAAGILVGAGILQLLGASDPVLWGVLPVAVLLAAYAPRVISFAFGQAGFTIALVILFNLIDPIGWRVGLIRIEDVAIGFAVSLGVGLVFWPRGAALVLRQNIGLAYSRGADFLSVAVGQLTAGAGAGDPHRAELAATASLHQLDDAFRQYLAERSAGKADPESAGRLVAGASRIVRAARSMAAVKVPAPDAAPGGPAAAPGAPAAGRRDSASGPGGTAGSLALYSAALDGQAQAVRAWYVTLGDSLANGTSVPQPQRTTDPGRDQLLAFVREALAGSDPAVLRTAFVVLWTSQHLDMLRRLEAHLGQQALAAASALPAVPGGSQAGPA